MRNVELFSYARFFTVTIKYLIMSLSALGESVRRQLLDSSLPFDFINVQIRIWLVI